MARPITATSGGANRRFLLLALFAAGFSAVIVYIALSSASGGGGGGGGAGSVPAIVAATDIPARTQITQDMIELRQISADTRSALAFTDPVEVVGKVTRFAISANEQVLTTKVVALSGTEAGAADSLSFVIPAGMRGISISVQEVVSAGGLVLPGDYVDVLAVFDVDFRDGENDQTEEAYFARTVLQNVEVLAVAQDVVDVAPATSTDGEEQATTAGQRERASESDPNADAVTVTLSVTPEQAQLLFLAEANGTLRLSVRPFGDADQPPLPVAVETELIPPDLPAPSR